MISVVGSRDPVTTARRLRLALELFDAGEDMMRQTLRRRFPDATDAEIQARLDRWLHERPGAEDGDAPGRRVAWPRAHRR
jgi:hypothetical protein